MSPPGSADVPVGTGSGRAADEDVCASRGWYSRGYLPHRDHAHLIQSITFRLADGLPQETLKRITEELLDREESQREIERRKRIEQWLDTGMGCCALGHPEVARYVQDAFLHFHGQRYHLHAWCIMPNHVHLLIEPLIDIATIVQGWKSFTARWVLKRNDELALKIPSSNQLWLREYWDRYIRDPEHYRKAVDYIHQNPVKAGLCQTAADWPWSSAAPGSADVLVGIAPAQADVLVGIAPAQADGDVGAPSTHP